MESPNGPNPPKKVSISVTVYEKLSSLGVKLPEQDKLWFARRGGLEPKLSSTSLSSTPKPKRRKGNFLPEVEKECCFGNPLSETSHWSAVRLDDRTSATVPSALVKMVSFLSNHLDTEGLFRKTGSIPRQKAIRAELCKGKDLSTDISAHDVANLLKTYFRELPVCLFMNTLLESFVSVARNFQDSPVLMKKILLDLCLLLPDMHQHVLQYVMQFFYKLSEHSASNRMDLDNLSVVLTPNLMPSTDAACPDLDFRTKVVKVLLVRSRFLAQRRRELAMGNFERVIPLSCAASTESLNSESGSDRKRRRRASVKGYHWEKLPSKRRRSNEEKPKSEAKKPKLQARLSKLIHGENRSPDQTGQ